MGCGLRSRSANPHRLGLSDCQWYRHFAPNPRLRGLWSIVGQLLLERATVENAVEIYIRKIGLHDVHCCIARYVNDYLQGGVVN